MSLACVFGFSQEELLDLVLHGGNLREQTTVGVSEDSGSHDGSRYTASATEIILLFNVNVRHILNTSKEEERKEKFAIKGRRFVLNVWSELSIWVIRDKTVQDIAY